MEAAPRLLRFPKSECPDVWYVSTTQHCRSSGSHLRGLSWRRQLEEVLLEFWWESTKLGMFVCSSKTRIILIRKRGWHQNYWKEAEYGSHVEEIDEKTLILMNQLHFLIPYTWDVPNVNANRMNLFGGIYKDVWITYFCCSNWKIPGWEKPTRKDDGLVLRHGRTCFENALSDTVNRQTRKWSSKTMFQVLARMIINWNRRNLNQSENNHKYAHKLFWNACTWHELEDLTFFGLSTHLQEQSKNGLRHATDDWQDWFHTFTTQMTTNNITMWVTRPSIVDWVYFKTQALLATLRTRNQLREESMYLRECRTFVTISWMCSDQTSVSHSYTVSEIISLDAGLRMDGLLVLRSTNNTARQGRAQGDFCNDRRPVH